MRKTSSFFVLFFLLSTFYLPTSDFASADFLNQTVIFSTDPQYEYLNRKQVNTTLRKISNKAYWYISDDYWTGLSEPEKNLFLTKLDDLAQEFDSIIYPIETVFWGSEPTPGIDNDPKIAILITKLIDQAGGYFDTVHLYKKSQAPESNEREMVFINSSSLANGRAKIFLAHEFQHLIAFYQKDILKNVPEDVWLNEIRAEYAPRLLGYDEVFENSNLRRRLIVFGQNPSEPLGEWKNLAPDYGAATLFGYYLVDNYGDWILKNSLFTSSKGIDSINETLRLRGLADTFSDLFLNWTIANILNDQSLNQKFGYKSASLRDFKIQSSQSYGISGIDTLISISNSVKDWQPVWYEFNTPIGNTSLNLKIDFSADSGTKFVIPYIAFYVNGQKEIGFIPVSNSIGTKFFKNFGSDIYKIIVIPANHSKAADFTKDDPASYFNLKAQLTAEFKETIQTPTLPPSSETLQSLLNQISALQNQIAQLREKKVSSPVTAGFLNRNLFIGSQGEDVGWLQDFLIKEGIYPEARITGYFGAFTKNAVIRFQQKYGISPQIGYVGLKTRAKMQELLNF